MAAGNHTRVSEFVLMGVSGRPELQVPLFLVFLVIYVLTAAGNLGIIALTTVDPRLQTPMYFFLRHLAVINLGDSTVIAPKMLSNFLAKKKTISYYGCATQLGGFLVFIVAEIYMLAVMAYDRYVAICNPLLYVAVVSRRVCLLLVSLTYLYGLFTAVVVTPCVFSVSYCSSNVINHFYCDDVPLLALSCSDTYLPETAVFIFSGTNLFFSMIIVLISYVHIVFAILRIHSAEGRKKAFSTCASHMVAVTVFYGTLLFMYLQPRANHSLDTDKMASVFYTLVVPMLNPVIYSLRNKDVKDALKKFLDKPCQSFTLNLFIITEVYIMSAMAYDRHVAICNPLLYGVVMSTKLCHALVAIPYLYSVFLTLLAVDELCQGQAEGLLHLRSHLTVISMFYGTLFFTYVQPKSSHSFAMDKMASAFYTLVIPMLDPVIYSLRNREAITDSRKPSVVMNNPKNKCWTTQAKKEMVSVATKKYRQLEAMVRNRADRVAFFFTVESFNYRTWMGYSNISVPSDFILAGVTRLPGLQLPLFVTFLAIYTVTVVGNLGMILLTRLDSRLHTPMYFFIRHLAFIDLGNSTVICPKMLVNFVANQNIISFHACATQMAFFILFIVSELSILSVMAYDRYMAICSPLMYNVIMSRRRCHVLVGIPYLYSAFQALLFPIKYFTSAFCGPNIISHFYCDVVPLLPLICSQAQDTELLTLLFSAFNLISLLVLLASYLLILLTVCRMRSAEGIRKAFSTCGSHLTVVVVFYGTLLFMYVQPHSTHSHDTDKSASVFYTLVIPMLNPLIYSLRNTEVKNAFQRVFRNQLKTCI
ncbi:LOW QUALITY PROTEIN: uncharacterized protein ACOB6Z_010534 [Ctenodactylus gundi]